MRFLLRTSSLAVVIATSIVGLGHALAADPELEQLKSQLEAQINGIKAGYEARIDSLEKRIGSLEADNARLKREAKPVPAAAASSSEIASLKTRVTELEMTADKPSAQAVAASKRASANAVAIEAIELKLQADASEARDILCDVGGWYVNFK